MKAKKAYMYARVLLSGVGCVKSIASKINLGKKEPLGGERHMRTNTDFKKKGPA